MEWKLTEVLLLALFIKYIIKIILMPKEKKRSERMRESEQRGKVIVKRMREKERKKSDKTESYSREKDEWERKEKKY